VRPFPMTTRDARLRQSIVPSRRTARRQETFSRSASVLMYGRELAKSTERAFIRENRQSIPYRRGERLGPEGRLDYGENHELRSTF